MGIEVTGEREERLEALVRPVLDELDLTLWELEVQSGKLRLVVERAGASGPGTGVTVGELGRVNREVNALLEADPVVPIEWEVEVSSPGVERDLRRPEHWESQVGDRVRVVLVEPVGAHQVLEGELLRTGDMRAAVRLDGDEEVEFALAQVRRARTVFELKKGQKRKPSKGRGAKD